MPRFHLNLYLETDEGTSWAPEGPGWYLDARRDVLSDPPGREVSGRVRLPTAEVEQLGQVLDKFTAGKPINWALPEDRRDNVSISQGITAANQAAAQDIAALLAEIERQAQNIAALRTRLGEFQS